jgi:protein-disulfide isomerase
MSIHSTARLVLPVGPRDHIRGLATAPVTLVEYGDFECPYCGEAYVVLEAVVRSLPKELCFVFRHFPLTQLHPHAQNAAEAVEAAGAQHLFWEMHDIVFTHQSALEAEALVDYATSIGLDPKVFIPALAQHRYAPRVREDFLSGVKSGVNGTPTLFLNDIRYDGPRDYDSLRAAIKDAAQSS